MQFYQSLRNNNPLDLTPCLDDFVHLAYGSYLIFSPTPVHGNVLNMTDSSRVSVNIRFKSVFSAYTPSVVSDRTYGTYYKKWITTDLFNLGLDVYNLLK